MAQAAAEGLTLQSARLGVTGYKGVRFKGSLYSARTTRAGKEVYLGSYATAEEAALAYARMPERKFRGE